MRYLLACAALSIAMPAAAATSITYEPAALIEYHLTGPAVGYQFTIQVTGGVFDADQLEVVWRRTIQRLYPDEAGNPSGHESDFEPACYLQKACSSAPFSTLFGTARSVKVRSEYGYNHCVPGSPAFVTCGYNLNFDLGEVDIYGPLTADGGPATLSISDPTAIPEPYLWAMMTFGLATTGCALRRRRATA